MEKKILVSRIDERLIHGQVVTSWIKVYPIEKIIIIDDELTKNNLMMRIYKAAAPTGVEIDVHTIETSVSYILNDPKVENIMLLAKTPNVFEEIINRGVVIPEIILGGMGAKEGRSRINRNISVNSDEITSLENILSKNINIIYQMVPDDKRIDVKVWLERIKK